MSSFTAYRFVPHILQAGLSLAALGVGMAAYSAETAESGKVLEEVIVTGSRIPQTEQTSTSPLQVVTEKEFKLQGTTDVIDLLNTLPQQFQNSATDFSNTTNPLTGPGGLTTANLRGLGPQRTLVLVNGKRLGVGDANTGNPNPSPDLDQIPVPLIESVSVLTGGASAVYGSDAIAGVVDFKTKRNFQGVQVDAHYGFNDHNNGNSYMQGLERAANIQPPDDHVRDGYNKEYSIVLGVNSDDGKANVTGYFVYREADPVSQGQRDYSACKLNANGGNPAAPPSCAGTANSNQFIENYAPNAVLAVQGTSFIPWSTTNNTFPPPLYNSNPYQYLSREDRRFLGGVSGHYDVQDWLKPYLDFTFMNDRSTTQVGASGLFQFANPYVASGGYLVNCDNPLLSAQQQTTICTPAQVTAGDSVDLNIGRRNVEGTGRQSEYEHINFRTVVGVGGDLGDVWKYDVYGQYYYTTLQQSNLNYFSFTAINRALQVVNVGGVPTCKSVVDGTDLACVPYNIFKDGGVTPAQVSYLDSLGTAYGTVTQKTIATNVNGDLGKYGIQLPTATTGIGVAVGTEYRKEQLSFLPDKGSQSGDLSGFGGASPAIRGDYSVQEEYIETRVPLIQGKSLAEDLFVEAGFRHSEYSLAGPVDTYKFAVQYAPLLDLSFRASYQRAIRAPNIIELFNPLAVTNTSVLGSDPCSGAVPTASLTACQRTGVTPAQYGTISNCVSGQCSVAQGGNPNVKPEKANTISLGFTFTPSFLQDFVAKIDYYKIDLTDEIGQIPINITFNNCLNSGVDCDKVIRNSIGALAGTTVAGGGYILGNLVNVGAASVSGIDVQLGYQFGVGGFGTVAATLSGSYLNSTTTTPLTGGPTYDCVGLFGTTCQTINPKWRHNMRISWQTPVDLLLSLQWRYIGGVALDSNTSDPQLTNGKHDSFNPELPAVSYLDLSFTYDLASWVAVRAGINNVLDKDPPLVSSQVTGTGAPNAYPTYDLLGRVVFLSATMKF